MRDWLMTRSGQRICVINAHRQYGKSTAMFQFADEYARKNPGSIIKIGGPFQNQINDIIAIVVNTVLQHCPRDLQPRYTKGEGFKYPNGSRIKLVGVDKNPNALRGTPNDLVILDEVGFMGDLDGLVFDIIMPTFNTRPHGRLIMISTPPEVLMHDYSAKFMPKAKMEDAYWELKITDNPNYTPGQIERFANDYSIVDVDGNVLLNGWDTDKFKREYLCEVVPDVERLIFPEWQHLKLEDGHRLVQPNIQPPSHYKPIVVGDWGFVDHTGIVYGWINWHEGTLHVKQETFVNYKTAYDISLAVKEKVQEVFPGIEESEISFWLDSDLEILREVRKYTGFNWFTCNGYVKSNKEGNINGIRELISKSRLFIDTQCKNLISQLDGGVWNPKRTDWERSDIMGHCDMLAALIYMNRVAPWKENPTPPRKKITGNHEVFVSPKFDLDNYSDKHEGFRKAFGGFK